MKRGTDLHYYLILTLVISPLVHLVIIVHIDQTRNILYVTLEELPFL